MPPARRHRLQRFQHKSPLRDARMGKDDGPIQNDAAMIQQIQIQAARRIGNGTLTPESRFDFVQKCQQRKGLEAGTNRGHRIQEPRVAGLRPRLGFVERRDRGNFDPCAGQGRQGSIESFGGWTRLRRNIGA